MRIRRTHLIYVLVVLLSVLLSAPFLIPARLIWAQLKADNASGGLSLITVSSISGVTTSGTAVLSDNINVQSKISWHVDPLKLLIGRVDAVIAASGEHHHLQGHVSSDGDSLVLTDIKGFIGASLLNPYLEKHGISATGELEIHSFNAELNNAWPSSIQGDLEWSGGQVDYRTNRSFDSYLMPPVTGMLSQRSGALGLEIRTRKSGQILLNLTLASSGWLTISVRGWLFSITGHEIPAGSDPDDVILEVEQMFMLPVEKGQSDLVR